ncbi:phage tail tube assembly chaperone [Furfurilactobacillus siliginis]|uniref:Uncharacterized protein n=1 Tax=Furfurilactobacillus siliginis TaxID=348151 RepID=A0A0R2LAP8_9LACO|nr:phage tail tube assembly chaperone [Furfurilactobacillus siliginis]KRN96853.1 hypothetical protein IV55_GL000721 [Furfurilactobacillus siliginis]GEK28521.1 hypothetical protein LSI01_08320 [Furfurilactobacillus siliginis]
MTIKIQGKPLGINKRIEVKPTIALVDKGDAMMIQALQANLDETKDEIKRKREAEENKKLEDSLSPDELKQKKADDEKKNLQDSVQSMQEERDYVKKVFDYFQLALHLTERQVEKAKEIMSFEDMGKYLYYVIGRIKGRSDEDFDLDQKIEAEKSKGEDPKKD